MSGLGRLIDNVLEAPIATSFTRIGYDVRSRSAHWRPLAQYDLSGRTVLVTGATSGLGFAAAEQFARCGATVLALGRSEAKALRVRDLITERTGNADVHVVVADMADLRSVRTAADQVLADHDRLDVLIHNAGTLRSTRHQAPDGTEETIASQVVGPFLLTRLLLDRLRATPPGRVLTMSSGGLYSTGLTVDGLEMGDDYKGTEQYARAKRAQVTLNRQWANRFDRSELVFHALHPGWADTPGVATALPTFKRVVGPLLRTPAQGADTLVWLAADDGEPLRSSGDFWLDRRRRPLHRLPSTRRTDTPERGAELWKWVVQRSGVDASTLPPPRP